MTIDLQGTHLELTSAIREYVEQRFQPFEKLVVKWDLNDGLVLKIELARTTSHHHKGNVFYAEANLALPKKHLRVEKTDADIRAAIDALKDTLRQDITKYKEMHSDH